MKMVQQNGLGLVRCYKYINCVFCAKALPRRRVSVAVVPKFNLLNIPGQAPNTGGPSPGPGAGLGTAAGPSSGPGALPVLVSSILINFFGLQQGGPLFFSVCWMIYDALSVLMIIYLQSSYFNTYKKYLSFVKI